MTEAYLGGVSTYIALMSDDNSTVKAETLVRFHSSFSGKQLVPSHMSDETSTMILETD